MEANKIIGITGGIGSGKSVVSRLLEVLGVPVYIADTEAKRLMHTDSRIREGLSNMFGAAIYSDGKLDKAQLARSMFGHSDRLAQVNALVHPLVREDFRRWVALQRESGCHVVGLESAILIESGFSSEVDDIWMIYAPLEVRLRRAMVRDGASENDIRKRICSQMDDEEKKNQAHHLVINDGFHLLIPQVKILLGGIY